MSASYDPISKGEQAPELARAIGEMILAWTEAEERQAFAIAAMLDLNPDVAVVLYQKFPNFRSRTQVIYALVSMHPAYEGIRKPTEKLSSLSKTRNRYVHCTYLQHDKDPSDIRSVDYSQLQGSAERSKPVKAADIDNHTRAVLKRSEELHEALWQTPRYKDWLAKHLPHWT